METCNFQIKRCILRRANKGEEKETAKQILENHKNNIRLQLTKNIIFLKFWENYTEKYEVTRRRINKFIINVSMILIHVKQITNYNGTESMKNFTSFWDFFPKSQLQIRMEQQRCSFIVPHLPFNSSFF